MASMFNSLFSSSCFFAYQVNYRSQYFRLQILVSMPSIIKPNSSIEHKFFIPNWMGLSLQHRIQCKYTYTKRLNGLLIRSSLCH